ARSSPKGRWTKPARPKVDEALVVWRRRLLDAKRRWAKRTFRVTLGVGRGGPERVDRLVLILFHLGLGFTSRVRHGIPLGLIGGRLTERRGPFAKGVGTLLIAGHALFGFGHGFTERRIAFSP